MRIIAGRWRGHPIKAPASGKTRPTTDRVREAWMSMLQPAIPGARVLDLFAGSGALGLETLSRGAEHATFVERSGSVLKVLNENIRTLDAGEQCRVVRGDAIGFVESMADDAYDIVLADPPYDSGEAAALADRFLRRPFADMLWIEHRISDELPDAEGAASRRYGDTVITRYLNLD